MSTPAHPAAVTAVITERRVTAPPEVQEARAEAVRQLDQLGMIDADAGRIPGDLLVGFDITIGGVTVPVQAIGYEIAPGEAGPQLTVTFPVDSIAVSGIAAAQPAKATPAATQRPVRLWERPPVDPRAGIPGWEPEAEVADRG